MFFAIHSLIGVWIVSICRLLWIMLLKHSSTSFCVDVFLFSLGVYLQAWSYSKCLIIWGVARLFPQVATPLYKPTSSVWGFQLLHIITNTCFCPSFRFYIVLSIKWYLMVALISFPRRLIMSNIFSWFFGYLCIFLEKYLCRFCAWFLTGLFIFLLLSGKSSFCILDSGLIRYMICKYFSHPMGCLFTFLKVAFESQKFFILMKFNLSLFPFTDLLLISCLRNLCQSHSHKGLLCFLLRVLWF